MSAETVSKDKEFAMLVLSRKTGERIHIGENITIEIRRVAGNRVTLALEAPRTVRILRGELEQAAKEFREPVEFEIHTDQLHTEGEAASGFQVTGGLAAASSHEDQTGPEPYAVIHRRMSVVPPLSPMSHPAIS
jgi:carbon storage regulator CsrA